MLHGHGNPHGQNFTPPQNVQRVSGLTLLLRNMKEELGQQIAEERAAQHVEVTVAAVVPDSTDKITDVDVLKSENAALKAKLETLDDDWLNMSDAFVAFVKHLVKIGLIVAPTSQVRGSSASSVWRSVSADV